MKSKEYITTQVIAHIVCVIMSLIAVLPFILLIIGSFTDDAWATANGYSYFPGKWSLEAYKYILARWDVIGRAYVMSFVITILGTSLSLVITFLFAYAISQRRTPGMKILRFMLVFTMLFNGGLVSTYFIYTNVFHIRDTIWALIVPGYLMSAFNVILVRNYFMNSIPYSLIEAARLDGATEFGIFLKVVIPLSTPIIATIGLLTGLGYWNDWQNGMYYLTERRGNQYYTIQIVLNNINENIQTLRNAGSMMKGLSVKMPSVTIRMAIATLGVLPIFILYPFFQKYFIKGITIGGVKE